MTNHARRRLARNDRQHKKRKSHFFEHLKKNNKTKTKNTKNNNSTIKKNSSLCGTNPHNAYNNDTSPSQGEKKYAQATSCSSLSLSFADSFSVTIGIQVVVQGETCPACQECGRNNLIFSINALLSRFLSLCCERWCLNESGEEKKSIKDYFPFI